MRARLIVTSFTYGRHLATIALISRAQRASLPAADSDQGLPTDFCARLGPRIYRGPARGIHGSGSSIFQFFYIIKCIFDFFLEVDRTGFGR